MQENYKIIIPKEDMYYLIIENKNIRFFKMSVDDIDGTKISKKVIRDIYVDLSKNYLDTLKSIAKKFKIPKLDTKKKAEIVQILSEILEFENE